jgi:hypothetical protein
MLDDRVVEKKEMRGGLCFASSVLTELDFKNIRNAVEKCGAQRTLVIGDRTGEIAHAAHWDEGCSTYAMGIGPEWNKYGGMESIKLVGSSSEKIDVEDPVGVAQELPPQELDCVVVHASGGGDAASVWLEKHVRPGGYLVMVDPEGIGPELDVDSEYPTVHLESSCVDVVIKAVKNAASQV